MSEAISFPEHTCWDDEYFRNVRKPVIFRVFNTNQHLGMSLDVEFEADYGVWYHQNDDSLVWYLQQAAPHVDWASLIYHRKWDHSGIDICEPDRDRVVARIEVRQFRGDKDEVLSGDWGSNVIRLDDERAKRMNAMAAEETELLLTEVAGISDV